MTGRAGRSNSRVELGSDGSTVPVTPIADIGVLATSTIGVGVGVAVETAVGVGVGVGVDVDAGVWKAA